MLKPGQCLNDLFKGAKKRFPFNPKTDVTDRERDTIHEWQQDMDPCDREDIPEMHPNAKARALHSLHAVTKVRRRKSGEREFLLHRGMSDTEYHSAVSNGKAHYTEHNNPMTSWTPDYDYAKQAADDFLYNPDEKPKVLSAWIRESAIHHVPRMVGDTDLHSEKEPGPKGNKFNFEEEVIVKPHYPHELATKEDLADEKRPSQNIHNRINNPKLRTRFQNKTLGRTKEEQKKFDRRVKGKVKKSELCTPPAKGSTLEKMGWKKPYDASKLPDSYTKPLADWTEVNDAVGRREEQRQAIPEMTEPMRARALQKLHAATDTRRNPKTGEREFLLHRGMREEEHDRHVKGKQITYHRINSWSADKNVAQHFGEDANYPTKENYKPGLHLVSAWVPESKIHFYAKMAGTTGEEGRIVGRYGRGKFQRAVESEVMTKPGQFEIHSKHPLEPNPGHEKDYVPRPVKKSDLFKSKVLRVPLSNGLDTKVYRNPTEQQASHIMSQSPHGARYFVDPDYNLHMWDAYDLTHADVMTHLGVEHTTDNYAGAGMVLSHDEARNIARRFREKKQW